MTQEGRFRFWGRRVARWGTAAYAVLLVVLIVALRQVGEQWWVTSMLLFVPPHCWLLPLPGLLLLALWTDCRLLRWQFLCLLIAIFGLFRFRVPLPAGGAKEGDAVLKVVINNLGEHNGYPVTPFLLREDADLMVLQDTRSMQRELMQTFSGKKWHLKPCGEHLLISRFPIRKARLLPSEWRRSPAAVFEVDWNGKPVSVYSVHLPTPRTEFRRMGGKLLERKGLRYQLGGTKEGRVEYLKASMKSRVRSVDDLVEIAALDPNPVLLVGDFNMPRWGYLYQVVSGRFTDAFEERGFGFGFTVSGEVGSLFFRLGPWVRIDYLFCDEQWQPLTCRVEPDRKSQHRAVVATFKWIGKP